jgi:hypothetical protein
MVGLFAQASIHKAEVLTKNRAWHDGGILVMLTLMPRTKKPDPFQMPLIMPVAMMDAVLVNYEKLARCDPTLATHLAHLQDMTNESRGRAGERVLFTRIKSAFDDMAANKQAPTGNSAKLYADILTAGAPFFEEVRARARARQGQPDPFVADIRDHPDRVLIGSMKAGFRHAPRR